MTADTHLLIFLTKIHFADICEVHFWCIIYELVSYTWAGVFMSV